MKRLPDLDGAAQIENGALHIGPYRAGAFVLRLETKDPVPVLDGSVEGEFRTCGLAPMQPSKVQITFSAGETRLTAATFPLAAPIRVDAVSQVPIRRARADRR